MARTLLDWAEHARARGDDAATRARADQGLTTIGDLPLGTQRARAERMLAEI
jgi:hypothetical protein